MDNTIDTTTCRRNDADGDDNDVSAKNEEHDCRQQEVTVRSAEAMRARSSSYCDIPSTTIHPNIASMSSEPPSNSSSNDDTSNQFFNLGAATSFITNAEACASTKNNYSNSNLLPSLSVASPSSLPSIPAIAGSTAESGIGADDDDNVRSTIVHSHSDKDTATPVPGVILEGTMSNDNGELNHPNNSNDDSDSYDAHNNDESSMDHARLLGSHPKNEKEQIASSSRKDDHNSNERKMRKNNTDDRMVQNDDDDDFDEANTFETNEDDNNPNHRIVQLDRIVSRNRLQSIPEMLYSRQGVCYPSRSFNAMYGTSNITTPTNYDNFYQFNPNLLASRIAWYVLIRFIGLDLCCT